MKIIITNLPDVSCSGFPAYLDMIISVDKSPTFLK